MSLHIVIGFNERGASAEPHLVYAGRSGSAASAAKEKSTALYFEEFHNQRGLRKNNPRAAQNASPPVNQEKAAEEAKAAEEEAAARPSRGKKY